MPISPGTMEGRKSALVSAARALIREKGGAGFSMRELAKKAGVSPATPYNLLSNKANLLALVVQDEFQDFQAKLGALRHLDAFDRLFGAVDLLSSHYGSDRKFYFGLFRSSANGAEGALAQLVSGAGRAIFHDLLESAVLEYSEKPLVDTRMMTDVLLRVLRVTVEAWYLANWPVARFGDELAFSARLLLLVEFPGSAQGRLRADLLSLQARLLEYGASR